MEGEQCGLRTVKSVALHLPVFLALSIFTHYNTGINYTATCVRIYAVLEYSESRREQVLGKDLGSECIERWRAND